MPQQHDKRLWFDCCLLIDLTIRHFSFKDQLNHLSKETTTSHFLNPKNISKFDILIAYNRLPLQMYGYVHWSEMRKYYKGYCDIDCDHCDKPDGSTGSHSGSLSGSTEILL
jgi:hypothetical protein